jgi:hypothetical protein
MADTVNVLSGIHTKHLEYRYINDLHPYLNIYKYLNSIFISKSTKNITYHIA